MQIELIFGLAILIFSIIIHEVMHGVVANWLGDPTARLAGRLTLNPIPHIDLFGSIIIPAVLVLTNSSVLFGWAKPVPYNPYNLKNARWGEALVAGAGPGVNLLIAIIFGLVIRFGVGVLPETFVSLASLVVIYNIMLALFNLIPIPPLDGSKVLASLLPYHLQRSFLAFGERIASFGIIGLFLFLILFAGVFFPIFSTIIFSVFSFITGLPV
jgi:Zn-dependent protease